MPTRNNEQYLDICDIFRRSLQSVHYTMLYWNSSQATSSCSSFMLWLFIKHVHHNYTIQYQVTWLRSTHLLCETNWSGACWDGDEIFGLSARKQQQQNDYKWFQIKFYGKYWWQWEYNSWQSSVILVYFWFPFCLLNE